MRTTSKTLALSSEFPFENKLLLILIDMPRKNVQYIDPSKSEDGDFALLMRLLGKHPVYTLAFTCLALYGLSMVAFYMR